MNFSEMGHRAWEKRYAQDFMPAAPVRDFVLSLGMRTGELAEFMETRSLRSQATWCRRLQRIFTDDYVSVAVVDEICAALGRHLAEVDPYYQEAM